jgi:Type I restriction modification DNA specificity domain
VICLQPYAEIDTRFLMFALMRDSMQSLIYAHATGLTAKGIKAAKLKPLPIPIPPLAGQHRIVAKVSELMNLCVRPEASLATCEVTRRELLHAVDGTTLTGQNHATRVGTICVVRNVAAIIAKGVVSAENAVQSLGPYVPNAAPPTNQTKTSAATVAPRSMLLEKQSRRQRR